MLKVVYNAVMGGLCGFQNKGDRVYFGTTLLASKQVMLI